MQNKSLGNRTDLLLPKYEGMLLDRGDYLTLLTPTIPGYFRGKPMSASRLFMLADEHYYSARIYEAAGFKPRER